MQNIQNELTQTFKQYLKQIGYSKTTVNMLPACVLEFLQYTNTTEPKTVSQAQIESFYEYLQNRPHKRKATPLSVTYINHNMYSLSVFFSWLEQTHQIQYNPISNLTYKRGKTNTREPLSTTEIIELFAAAQNNKEIAILHLFYSCGLRRTEAQNLNISDIHFTQNLLYVRDGKGSKRRVIPITEKVKKELENYYKQERIKPNSHIQQQQQTEEAFILNKRGARMRGNQYNDTLKKIIIRSALPIEHCTLHHLRHSIATHLLANGVSIELVRDFLGHRHLESTQIYAKVFTHQLKQL
jgi:integrase/recombinase XerD